MNMSFDREKIEREIKEKISTLITEFEALNTDSSFAIYSNSPNFRMIGSDGSLT
jgi:hypothetical protein